MTKNRRWKRQIFRGGFVLWFGLSAHAAFPGYGFSVCLPQMSSVIFSAIMVSDNG
jgi:hypothetical protein